MLRQIVVTAAAALTVTASLAAQTKTITGATETVTATVEAIEKGTRQVYLKKPDGKYEVVYVPEEVKRFDSLKVGDKITARYYQNVVLRVQQPGAKPVDESSRAVTPAPSGTAGTAARQRTITATITAIDPKVPSITFTGPKDWTYSTRVEDKAALAKVKVGDKVDITWTDAVMVTVEDPK
jgi:Cu/Ag efflux protein CusF